jgi:hypothetical protein
MILTFENLTVNEEKLLSGFKSEIYATDEVFRRLKENIPFRELYLDVGKNLEKVGQYDPYEAIKNRTSVGTSGNLQLKAKIKEANDVQLSLVEKQKAVFESYQKLANFDDSLIN